MSRRHRHRERDAITRMLGAPEAAGGPFALLGLPVGDLTDEQIVAALDGQLMRLADHRECDTPGADEVRLALHSAAAQLLDARVRAHLVSKWSVSEAGVIPLADDQPSLDAGVQAGDPPREHVVPAVPESSPSAAVPSALREAALVAIASSGGWNAQATRRVVALAAGYGLDGGQTADLFRAIFTPTPSDSRPRPVAETARSQTVRAGPGDVRTPNIDRSADADAAPLAEQQDPGRRVLKYALLTGLGVLTTLGAAIVLAVALIEASKAPAVPAPTDAAPSEVPRGSLVAAPEPSPTPETPPEPPPMRAVANLDADTAGREIQLSAKALESDPPQAIEGFERAVEALAEGWAALSPDRLVAAQQDVIEFLYRAASREELLRRAVTALGAPAGVLATGESLRASEVAPAVWSAGMLTRLVREKDLPAAVETQARRAVGAALAERLPVSEQTFEAGARAATRLIPLRLVPKRGEPSPRGTEPDPKRPSIEGWERWLAVMRALEPDPHARARAVLAALESVLADGPEPTESELAFRAVRLLTSSVTWRSGDESRRWLLALFDDPRATSADLHAATSSVATASSAENVDVTMVVPVLASARVRTEYRQRYAKAWGLESGSDRDALLVRVEQTARDLAARADADASPLAALATAVVLSRFNEAVASLWAGRPDAAAGLLDRLGDGAEPPPPPSHSPPGASVAGGDTAITVGAGPGGVRGTWTERYLAAKRNVPIRAQLLGEFPRTGAAVSAADAEVLAYEAIRGSPNEIRASARELLRSVASSSTVVNALLELLPETPQTAANSALIESIAGGPLPAPSARDWESQARRLLVERLVELVASESEFGRVDALAALLARSYDDRTLPPALGPTPARTAPPAEQSAAMLWRQWRDRVDGSGAPSLGGLTLDEAERRRTGRVALARGRVQVFAAQQASLCELMALVIAAERPAAAARVEQTLDLWHDRRAAATHVLGQVQVTERAMSELWLIRVGGAPP